MFTDGSYMKKNGKTLAGYGVYFYDNVSKDISRPLKGKKTNMRAELYAIYKGIKRLLREKGKNIKIVVYSDSEYSIKTITVWADKWKKNNWRGKKNLDIIKPLYELYKKHEKNIEFNHVHSHTKKNDFASIGNDIADRLAKTGALLSMKK